MIQERRQYRRLVPDSAPAVYLGESWIGFLFDLSEGGLAVDGLPPRSPHQDISVAFDLPEGYGHIRARAEIAWTSDTEYRTGLRFLDLAETSRQQFRDWISAKGNATGLVATETEAAQSFSVADVDALASAVSDQNGEEELAQLRSALAPVHRIPRRNRMIGMWGRLGKLRHPFGIFVAVAIFAPVFVFLGHLLANKGNIPLNTETTTVAASASHAQGVSEAPEPHPAAALSRLATVRIENSGFVLQVAAMTHESNANVLKESLEQKNFPAFVIRRGTGHFYKVNVGPYSDVDTAARVKSKLEVQGFEAIVTRWSPE